MSSKIDQFIEALKIVKKYRSDAWAVACAEHDIIFLDATTSEITPESEDGQRLQELGFHVSEEYEDSWVQYV